MDDTDDAIKRQKEWQKLAASSSELMNADVRATSLRITFFQVIEATPSQLIMPRVIVSASLGNLWENWDVADLSFWMEHMDLERNKNRIRYARNIS